MVKAVPLQLRGSWILLSRALYEKKELYGYTEAVTKMLIS